MTRHSAIKTLDALNRLLESIDEDPEGDVSGFETPSDRRYLLVTLDRERGANDRYDYEVKAPNDEYALKYAIIQLLSLMPDEMDPSTQDLLKLEQEHPGIFDDPDDNEMLADWGIFVVSLTNIDTGDVVYSTDRDFEFDEGDIDD